MKRVKSTPLRVLPSRPPLFFLLLLLFFFHRAAFIVSQTGRERWCHHHHHARVRRHHSWNEGIICAVLHLRSRQVHVRKPLKRVHASGILRGRRGKFRRRFVNNFPRNVVGGDSREQIARYLFEKARKRIKSQCEWINARKKRSRVQFNLEIKEKRIARWPLTRGPFSVFRSISPSTQISNIRFRKNKNKK